MQPNSVYHLNHRAALEISGNDASRFLQGLITNDMNLLADGKAIYALMLTPNGRFLFEMFIYQKAENTFLVDVESEHISPLLKKQKL